MVETHVTDPVRIAQLLASELSGLEVGPLADVSVVDARPDATPAPDGTTAYRVAFAGEPFATVRLFPGHVAVDLRRERARWPTGTHYPERDGTTLRVETGAAVKRTVDAVRDLLDDDRER